MSEKIIYGFVILAILVACYLVFYDELIAFMTQPENQVTVGQELGINRDRE